MTLTLTLTLAACSEKPQASLGRKADAQAYQGAANDPYSAAGWQAGDAASWEQQMRNRAVYGQNEYARSSAP